MLIKNIVNIDKENIDELMLSFYYSTGLQIAYIDTNGNIVHSIPETPIYNPFIQNNYIQDIMEHASVDNEKNYSVYKVNMYEHFLCIPIGLNNDFIGVLTVGPIKCKNIKYTNIDFLISVENIPLSNKPKLFEYLNQVPLVEYYRLQYIASLLIKLCTSSYVGILKNSEEDDYDQLSSNFYDDKSIAYYEQFSKNRELRYTHHPYYLEKKINSAIKNLDIDSIFQYMSDINNYPLPDLCKDNYVRSFKNHIIIECAMFSRMAIEVGVDSEISFTLGDTLIQKLETLSDVDKIKVFCKEMYHKFYKVIKKYSFNNYSYTLIKAIKFIHQNINSDISLNTVAKNISVNPCHLSTLFKKEIGKSYTDYINEQKIEEAKYLLTYSKLSILDIALYLNYNSQSYFTQVFKKIEGITPKMYRQNKKGG